MIGRKRSSHASANDSDDRRDDRRIARIKRRPSPGGRRERVRTVTVRDGLDRSTHAPTRPRMPSRTAAQPHKDQLQRPIVGFITEWTIACRQSHTDITQSKGRKLHCEWHHPGAGTRCPQRAIEPHPSATLRDRRGGPPHDTPRRHATPSRRPTRKADFPIRINCDSDHNLLILRRIHAGRTAPRDCDRTCAEPSGQDSRFAGYPEPWLPSCRFQRAAPAPRR